QRRWIRRRQERRHRVSIRGQSARSDAGTGGRSCPPAGGRDCWGGLWSAARSQSRNCNDTDHIRHGRPSCQNWSGRKAQPTSGNITGVVFIVAALTTKLLGLTRVGSNGFYRRRVARSKLS